MFKKDNFTIDLIIVGYARYSFKTLYVMMAIPIAVMMIMMAHSVLLRGDGALTTCETPAADMRLPRKSIRRFNWMLRRRFRLKIETDTRIKTAEREKWVVR